MLWSILLLSLFGYVSTVQVRMCANHWCTEPVYRGTAAEDWNNDHPGYLPLVKGAPVTVFGVENEYYDAESGGARGFIPKDKAIITETVHEPKVKFNPYYKEEDVPNGDKEEDVPNEDNEVGVQHEDNESDEEDIQVLAKPQTLNDIEGSDVESKIGDNLDSVLTGTGQIEQDKKDDEEGRIRYEQLQQKRVDQEKLKKDILERQKLKLKEEIRSRQKIEQEQKLEEQRLELQKLELQRLDQKRLEQIKLEQERMEQQKLDQQKLKQQKAEQEIIEHQKMEQERLAQQRLDQERLEQQRLEQEMIEQERLELVREQQRLENERLENERHESERLENDRLENERLENERLENERLENKRLENERLENEILKKERLENERRDNEKIESGRLEKEMLENQNERFEKEKLENERIENEKLKEENEKEMHKKEGEEAKKAAFLTKKKELEEQYRLRREEKKKRQSTHDKQQTEVSTDHQEQQKPGTLIHETDTSDTPVEEAQDSLVSPVKEAKDFPVSPVEEAQDSLVSPVEEAEDSLDPPVEEANSDASNSEPQKSALKEGAESISGDEALGSTGEYDEDFDDIGEVPEPHIPEDVSTKKEDSSTRMDANKNRDSTIKEPVHDFRSRYKALKKQSLPFYCSVPVLESLCDTVGSDAAILIVISTVFVGGLVAFVCFSGPSVPETTPQKTLTPPLKEASKSDPKVLEKLDEQAKAQKQLAGNLDDVLEKLARLTEEIKDLGSENKRYQAQLQKTQNKLTASTERTVKLENDSRDLRSQLHEQTGYNAGFVELENSLKQKMSKMEEKIANCRDIINTQESTALSTSDQIATLQTQLESTIIERDATQSELTASNTKVIELVSCLECTQEKLNTTQDLLDQADSDTEAWVVRVQILALQLEDAESSIANLKEDLESKSRDVDVIRECLVELRAQEDEDGDIDISSRFKDMVDVYNLKMENEKLVEANRDVHAELEEVREAHDCFEERVQDVEEEMDVLRKEKEEKEAKLREVTTTFQALSTYFKEKEDGLHCRLSELQVKCKQLEEESSEANILFYKEELSRIKKAHAENERNLTLQIQTNERKAKDAFAQLRSKDAKLKDTTELLKKLKKSNGSGSAIPEERPAPGPPFLDYPPPQLRKGGPTDSPSESSCTSAEDLETRRLERNMDFEKDLYPPDLRPFDDIRYGVRPYPDDMYRDGIYTPRDYPPPFDPRAMEPPRSRDSSRPPSAGRDDRLPSSRDPTFYTRDLRDLPPRDLPLRDYPARDILPQSLPPRDFAPRDAPPRVKPQYVPREVPKDIGGPMMPPRDVPRIPSRDGSGIPPVVPSRNANSLHRVNSNSEPDNISISAASETSFNMGV